MFVTELVAFFQVEKVITPECHKMKNGTAVIKGGVAELIPRRASLLAFSRAAFGLVTVRTDGERLLVCTNSGRTDLKEAHVRDGRKRQASAGGRARRVKCVSCKSAG